jgi:hypothetical protein
MESTRQIWYKIAFCITFFLGERNMIRKVLFGVFAAGLLSADTINSYCEGPVAFTALNQAC